MPPPDPERHPGPARHAPTPERTSLGTTTGAVDIGSSCLPSGRGVIAERIHRLAIDALCLLDGKDFRDDPQTALRLTQAEVATLLTTVLALEAEIRDFVRRDPRGRHIHFAAEAAIRAERALEYDRKHPERVSDRSPAALQQFHLSTQLTHWDVLKVRLCGRNKLLDRFFSTMRRLQPRAPTLGIEGLVETVEPIRGLGLVTTEGHPRRVGYLRVRDLNTVRMVR